MISYRNMSMDDIEKGLSLCLHAGWNQLARDWEMFLRQSPNGCLVAMKQERVVGTVTTMRYQDFFSWIGMVLVDRDHQKQGIGIGLLKEALQILSKEKTVKLDATPAGREVYLKLNFADEYHLSRMEAVIVRDKLKKTSATAIQKKDLSRIYAFDQAVFGADRRFLLDWLWEGAPQYAFLIEEKNELQGYCFGRNGRNFIHIGPVVANNMSIAQELVSAALGNCAGQPVILDVLHHQPQWLVWLFSTGFTEQRPFIRMYRGENNFPGLPEKQFAITGPEFG